MPKDVTRKHAARLELLEQRALLSATLPAISELKVVHSGNGATMESLTNGITLNTAQLTSFNIEADVTWRIRRDLSEPNRRVQSFHKQLELAWKSARSQ